MQATRQWLLSCSIGLLLASVGSAAAPGFVKTIIPLDAPPVGLAFDVDGLLYALEGALFGSNVATLRTILPSGAFGDSFPVVGDDPDNFFVGSMAYDPWSDRLLITDNTGDGRLYAVDKTGTRQRLALEIAGIAGVAVRGTGEIFVSTSPFGSAGAVLQVDRTDGSTTQVLPNELVLGFGAGLAFDPDGNLIVQDADATTFRGRLQQLPIIETPAGLEFGAPVPLIGDMQSSAGVVLDSEGDIFTTGSGGLFRIAGSPLAEIAFDENGNAFQFATAVAFDPGSLLFEGFAGANSGRLAYMADFGFAMQDSFVTLLTPAQPGDYNTDGRVDEADYTTWQNGFGSTTELAADGTGDAVVDATDYVVWRHHFAATSMQSVATNPMGLPEPTIFVLVSFGAVVISLRRRKRVKQE